MPNFLLSNILRIFAAVFAFAVYSAATAGLSWADQQPAGNSVEINGDIVEYSMDGNKVTARGNVVIKRQDTTLMCDTAEFFRDNSTAHADGHVKLISKDTVLSGDHLTYRFDTQTGDFQNAKISAYPYYGGGKTISKVGENHAVMKNAFMTTCDHDKPHYQMTSPKVDVYPGDKMVARGTRILLGKFPLLYLPKFSHRLDDTKPRILFTPGYTKDWGITLLSQMRYYLGNNVKGVLHLDLRERKGIAEGLDLNYKTEKYGEGLVRLYYMNERNMLSKHFYDNSNPPQKPIYKERFKAEWRHKWAADKNTDAIVQYYKLKDQNFLKDYFEGEYQKDSSPDTFFLLTRRLPRGTLSFQTLGRINRFESKVERLPEIRYDLSGYQIGETGLYLQNLSSFTNLTKKFASPTELRLETKRLHIENELSYPMKLGIIEFSPFVGHKHTYYSKTNDPEKYGSIRGALRTGASLSTKFYRIFDVEGDWMGMEVHRLRHILTPSVAYEYQSLPTLTRDHLDNFDTYDTLDRIHSLTFGLENKLQTKRKGASVDLVRALISTDFRLKDHPSAGGFDQIRYDMDFKPADWLTLYFDANYDTRRDHLSTANFDLYINGGNKWTLGLGKRFEYGVDDQITAMAQYRINSKWALKIYERFDIEHGLQKEQQFTLTRDLHEWEMDIDFHENRGEGSEILLIFRLKAFPDIGFNIGSGFNKRKAGSQSSP